MSCTNPILAVNLGQKDDGKNIIKFLPPRPDYNLAYLEEKYGDSLMLLPCGKCDSCKITHRKVWSLRCMLESQSYLQNCFVTLTYDDAHYDDNKSDRKEDLQKFIHSIRDSGVPFRYFACGERGSNGRFHYHMIMFGYFPPDAKPLGKKLNNMYYSSDILHRHWKKGTVIVGECSPSTCEYVAGYVNKKTNDLSKQNFITMSNKPGIGYDYFVKNCNEIYQNNCIITKNGKVSFPPKYCDEIAKRLGFNLDEIKSCRIDSLRASQNSEMQEHGLIHREMIFKRNGEIMKDKLKKRRLRNL